MEPLYTTQTAYTLEEYQKYNNAVGLNNKKFKTSLIILVCYILLLILVAVWMPFIRYFVAIIAIALIIVFLLFPFALKKNVKNAYASNTHLQKSGLCNFGFYNDYFEVKTNNSFSKVEYSDINRIIETKDNFYIMIAINQGYIIVKKNCSAELISFISSLKK